MKHVGDVIDCLGGNAELARRLSLSPSAISEMKRRQSIPSRYWAAILRLATESGRVDITADTLVGLHAIPEEDTSQAECGAQVVAHAADDADAATSRHANAAPPSLQEPAR